MGFGSCWKCRLPSFLFSARGNAKVTFHWASQFVGVSTSWTVSLRSSVVLGARLAWLKPCVFGLWHLSWRFSVFKCSWVLTECLSKSGRQAHPGRSLRWAGVFRHQWACCVCEPFPLTWLLIHYLSLFLFSHNQQTTAFRHPVSGQFSQKIVNLFFKKKVSTFVYSF